MKIKIFYWSISLQSGIEIHRLGSDQQKYDYQGKQVQLHCQEMISMRSFNQLLFTVLKETNRTRH